MKLPHWVLRGAAPLAILAGVASAQAPGATSNALPPIRSLGKVTAASTELLGAVSQVRALPGGRVLVNDNLGRKVVLFDPTLATFKIVADTTAATANAYSSRAGGLIQYKGDSTLFVDPNSLSMLVLDGTGNVARVISVPRPNDAQALVGGPAGTPGFDGQGRLVYRGVSLPMMNAKATTSAASAASGQPAFPMPTFPESTAIVRVDLSSRKLDTVAYIKIPKINMSVTQGTDGRISMSSITNPMPVVDDWAVTADGRVAVLRGQEYRLDWMDANGKVASTSKIPFAWRHLDDSTKSAFIDSTKKTMETLRQQQLARMQAGGGNAPVMFGPGDAPAGAGGGMIRIEMSAMKGDGGGGPPSRGSAPSGPPTAAQLPPLNFVAPSELPDYAPPFTAGSARGDAEGNLWVRTSNVYNNGSVYDIINSKGVLVDRVLLPPGRVIAGFGPGTVYMGFRDGAGVRLESAPTRAQATP